MKPIYHYNKSYWGESTTIITDSGHGMIKVCHDKFLANEVTICNLNVSPEKRRKGIGTKLIKLAEKEAKAFGVNKVNISVENDNVFVKDWYKRLGYETVRVGTYRTDMVKRF